MSNDNSMYDGVEFVASDLETMRKQYDRLRYDHQLAMKHLALLQQEVKAWREWHKTEPEVVIDEPLLYQHAINCAAKTDLEGALNERVKP